ncbi:MULTISPECIES: restriction endonuclease subunit S [Phocaeicola]|jgi:type I restriction enzyme S subunit|uniref:restriction endonuclease subunit S n=1 Tax=Phocaeicola TaxID=909656 RepID=UPI000E54A854|nr:restriction endonuclease subunit S [Phocaeicola vulgatus]MBU9038576.1 restriction endonuclease subunit S [Phocaeicola vulgatus]MCE8930168.1 restriction endonuclease subunit S [Phocaeicola vulgatus]MCE9180892.1 restriction endonuclease subunit S [Phocaeicola vulgatus]RHL57298.1 restriction endonuclease subunit S [Phocaeicola vulgatus]
MSNTWFRLRRGFFLSFFPSDTPHYENVPFELPNSWVWCRLEDIAYVASGSTPDKTCFVENGVPYIKMYNLRNQKIDFAYHPQYITEEVHNGKLQRSRTEVGDLIMNIVGPPLGKLAIIPTTLPQANFNQAAVLIRPYKFKEVLVSYLKVYLEEMSEINSIATRGSAGQVNISLTQSQNMRIPIPPLNEVRRIIEEVSKYDILIDSLKQNITDIQNLIAYTKSKILDLAIHGKLVPQDPNDEPAIELLKRINPDFTPCDNGHYPVGWIETILGELFSHNTGKALNSSNKEGIFKDYLTTSNVYWNKFDFTAIKQMPFKESELNKCTVTKGDLLVCEGGDIGRSAIWNYDYDICIQNHIHRLRPKIDLCVPFYYYTFAYLKENNLIGGKGIGLLGLSSNALHKIEMPLPPLAEQQRIVQKIEELFSVLDNIQNALEV